MLAGVKELRDKLHKTNPHTPEELRNNICHNISTISRYEFKTVNTVFRRYTECIRLGRQQFQHLLWNHWVFIRVYNGYYFVQLPSLSVTLPDIWCMPQL